MKFLFIIALIAVAMIACDSQVLNDFAVGNAQYSADVYKELLKSNSGSFMVCPLSSEIILALVHNGAGGNTAQELGKALRLAESKENILQTFTELSERLQDDGKLYTLSSANKIYVKDGYTIKDQFKSTAVDVFNADIQSIDFAKNKQAANEMNKWVEEKTHNKIKDLISEDDLDDDTRAVLINAMYFHGQWARSFPERATRKRPFYLNQQKQVQIDMMQQLNRLNYYESSELDAKFLDVPYDGFDVTMTFVLPNDVEGLPALESRLADVFTVSKYDAHLVEVVLPKFTVETTIKFNPILKALGVVEAFTDEANFDEILVNQPLKISKVIQKTFIEVEEKGTTAAAASAVELPIPASSDYHPPTVKQFVADRPFVYYIKIKDIIMFVGRYISP